MNRAQVALASSFATLFLVGIYTHLTAPPEPSPSLMPVEQTATIWTISPPIMRAIRDVVMLCGDDCQARRRQVQAADRQLAQLRLIEGELSIIRRSLVFLTFLSFVLGAATVALVLLRSRND